MIRQYVVDAFTDKVFAGNPAAVCVLGRWPDDALLQAIAVENNLSETAFAVPAGDAYRLRWFTPGSEVDLCGHATLATAWTIFRFYEPQAGEVRFDTLSGSLTVKRDGALLSMDLPAYELTQVPVTAAMEEALGARVTEAWMGRDLVCVLESAGAVRSLAPDQDRLAALDGLLVHATARGDKGLELLK